MKLVVDTPERIAELAAQQYVDLISAKPNAVLGFATGSTPLDLYAELVRQNRAGAVSFRHVTTFNLDEYLDMGGEQEQSYRYFMNKSLFEHIDIAMERTFLPAGELLENGDPASYDRLIESVGGIDVQLLGIGHNGHIGFNEPGTPFGTLTHVAELAESTVLANARFFDSMDEVPRVAATMGIKSVMNARSIIMVILGSAKAEIAKAALQGPVTEAVPASVLQLHPSVTWYVDHEAAKLL